LLHDGGVRITIVGAGIFGLTGALELQRRGHAVRVVDPGPVPHPLAASTDLSKVVRLEYGADDDYVALGERALDGWRRWNEEMGPVFHETGVLFVRRSEMTPGTFEHESFVRLRGRHPVVRVGPAELRARFPAWNAERYLDGTFNADGGWAESGRVVALLAAQARAEGVAVEEGRALPSSAPLARGDADALVVAAGAWTPHLLPETAPFLRSIGQPVFHLRPDEPLAFAAARFPVFGADISSTGWYGFPLHPAAGVVKIANHGVGRALHPESPERRVRDEDVAALRAFLADTFPQLAAAPLVGTRVCLYCDTWDGHFWIAPDPARPWLVLATGGSGHAFKFAPVLGELIADAVEGRAVDKFRWRPDVKPPRAEEAARHQ
jgi:glycine/D-amino acid oxidase-like deaminating enzyme